MRSGSFGRQMAASSRHNCRILSSPSLQIGASSSKASRHHLSSLIFEMQHGILIYALKGNGLTITKSDTFYLVITLMCIWRYQTSLAPKYRSVGIAVHQLSMSSRRASGTSDSESAQQAQRVGSPGHPAPDLGPLTDPRPSAVTAGATIATGLLHSTMHARNLGESQHQVD